MQKSSEELKEKVKMISLYDEKTNRLDKFIMSLKLLGEGKYGKVYKATHLDKPDLIFAVKVIQLTSEKIRKECLKELEIIKHLPNSLNLVKIHRQHLQSQNNLYIFEEYCDGGNMSELLDSRKGVLFCEEQIFTIFYQVVRGFLDIRKAGIFHEDIKPQNILCKNNLFKFTDFGISQLASSHQSSIVRRGTLSYMPPQKLKPENYIPTSKSEIFSLGITLYEVLFLHHPYLTKRTNDYRVYLREINQQKLKSAEELKQLLGGASMALDRLIRIILRMIDLSENKRLGLEELEDYIKHSEPFRTMKIVQRKQEKSPLQRVSNKKYDIISHSKVFVKDQQGMRDSLKTCLSSSSIDYDILKLYIQFTRSCSSFLLQGVRYCKESKIFELKKEISNKQFPTNEKIVCVDYLEFLLNFYNDYTFNQISKKYNQIIFTISQPEESYCLIESDVQFVKNEFLKVFMESKIQSKKELRQYLKDKQNQVALELVGIMNSVYKQISCLRIYFKEDILSFLFLKNASLIIKILQKMIQNCQKGTLLAKSIINEQSENIKKIIKKFNEAEIMKRSKLENILEQQLVGQHQVLFDIESNSDDFQVLDEEDF